MTPNVRSATRQAIAIGALALAAHAPLAWPQAAINCQTELYGASQSGALFRINVATGAGTLLGTAPINLSEIAFDNATGQLWASDGGGRSAQVFLRRLDPATGAQISAVAVNPQGLLTGLEFVGGTLYGTYALTSGAPSMLVSIDRTTGALTTIGPTGISAPLSGLAYDTASSTMFAVTAGGHAVAGLFRVNIATGAATFVAQVGNQDKIGSIRFGPGGALYAGVAQDANVNAGWLMRVDPVSGIPTLIGFTNFSVTGLAACTAAAPPPPPPPPPPPSQATPVPALSAGALAMLVALVSIAAALIRRRRAR